MLHRVGETAHSESRLGTKPLVHNAYRAARKHPLDTDSGLECFTELVETAHSQSGLSTKPPVHNIAQPRASERCDASGILGISKGVKRLPEPPNFALVTTVAQICPWRSSVLQVDRFVIAIELQRRGTRSLGPKLESFVPPKGS